MTFRELRDEYRIETIGSGILSEVRGACASLSRRYPPAVYARSAVWDADTVEELVQDVVLERLLGEQQMDYLFDVADRISDWRGLLYRQVKITLARRRVRTVVDNLLVRAGRYLKRAEGVDSHTGSGSQVFKLADARDPYRALADQEVQRIAEHVRVVPRRRPGSGERAPSVYSDVGLATVLDIILHDAPGGVAVRDIGRILELALTDWVPDILELDEARGGLATAALTPEERVEVTTIASDILASLSHEDAYIFRGQFAGLPDTELAPELGMSRPTLAKRRRALIDRLRGAAANLDERCQERLIDEIVLAIAAPENRSRSDG